MKITKLVHSCMIVDVDNKKILIDPGIYSWLNEGTKLTDFSNISAVVVTHNHPDHLNNDFAVAVNQASPNAKWYGTRQVAEQLKAINIECFTNSQDTSVQFVESKHADLAPWFDEQPEHTSFLLFSEVLISGDCQTLDDSHGARILAGAINGGPWGAVVGFSKMVESMKHRPKIVLPLHDWHWNEEARSAVYSKLPEVMNKFNVEFVPLENGVAIEL